MKSLSRRERKIRQSIWLTAVGLVAVSAFVIWVEMGRETDFGDPTAGLTQGFLGAEVEGAPDLAFADVAVPMGLIMNHGSGTRTRNLVEDTGSGVAWGDVDGDGDPDLYAVNLAVNLADEGPEAGNRLFRNDGGRFEDITAKAGVADARGQGMGASFADIDGDGHIDLHVSNRGPNRLFRNRGDGHFDEIAKDAGVADPLWSTGVAWGDYDLDGRLDLYVCNYIDYEESSMDAREEIAAKGGGYSVPFTLNPNSFDPLPNRLYRNLGDARFEELAESAGVHNPGGRSLAATFCDLDADGYLDLYVNNDVSPNRLYHCEAAFSDGDEVLFMDLSAVTGTADPRGSMGLSVGEIVIAEPGSSAPGDGLPDLFISHWVAQENALYQSLAQPSGRLEYRDKTRRMRLGEISIDTVGWGCAMVDLDLDGRPDIAVANGSTLEENHNPLLLGPESMFLFWNAGTSFVNLAAKAGSATATPRVARSLAAADFDGDGDVDLAITTNQGPLLLLRNDTPNPGHSLRIRLTAPPAKTFGALVEVEAGGRRQVQWSGCDVSYLGNHFAELIFGLGENDFADRVRVRWIGGGESLRTQVPAGRLDIGLPAR